MRQFVPDGLRTHVTCFANMREIVTQLAHCQRRRFTAHVERIVHLEMPIVVVLDGDLGPKPLLGCGQGSTHCGSEFVDADSERFGNGGSLSDAGRQRRHMPTW